MPFVSSCGYASPRPLVRGRVVIDTSRLEATLGLDIGRVDRGARRHEQAVALLAAEAQVGAGLGQMDLADEIAVRRVAAHAVLLGVRPAHAAPDIAVDVGAHAVGEAG